MTQKYEIYMRFEPSIKVASPNMGVHYSDVIDVVNTALDDMTDAEFRAFIMSAMCEIDDSDIDRVIE